MPLLVLSALDQSDNERLERHMNARVSCEYSPCRQHVSRVPTRAQLEAQGWAIERRGDRILIVCPDHKRKEANQ